MPSRAIIDFVEALARAAVTRDIAADRTVLETTAVAPPKEPKAARSRGYPSKAEIARVVGAARASGIDVAGLEVRPDGAIRLFESRASPTVQSVFDLWKDQM